VTESDTGTERYNLDRAKSLYEALFARDWAVVNEILSPDVVVREPEGLPYGGEYRGHDGFKTLMKNLAQHWADVSPVDMSYTAGGNVVHMEATLIATARATGREITLPFIESWAFENGRIVSGTIYYSDTHLVRQLFGLA
jgi:ketosteroid isomerase-like protein